MKRTLHIYHTNDLHSHFENWPKVVQYLKVQQRLHKDCGEEVLLFDIGDHLDRSNPVTEASAGKANSYLLSQLDYANITIGNNEGITLSHEDLDALYQDSNLQVVLANLHMKDNQPPAWLKPYDIHQLKDGTYIGVIGLTAPYTKLYELLGWNVLDPFERLSELLKEVKSQVSFLIVLSHLGINEDERLAREFPEIDLILGGHTHHILSEGLMIGKTLLCGAGKFGQYVGHVEIEIDSLSGNINKSASVHSVLEMEDDKETQLVLKSLESESNEKLKEAVTYLSEDLLTEWFKKSSFPNLLATALKEWCNSELSMVNSGVLLDSLYKGEVTKGDLHRICPHPINPCKVLLKGDVLKEIILQASTPKMEKLEIVGLGFRGKVMGKMVYDGVTLDKHVLSDGQKHIRNIWINGEIIKPDRIYEVATLDMFTFGHIFPEIAHANEKHYFMPELLRDLLAWKLQNR
ncbi:bifunctional metallophosphatase/5'-nucleotidase [Bacillus timonensis]|nr:bifunctional metallophosphatase/5'-nucleotidase [Bacillus timonensis]